MQRKADAYGQADGVFGLARAILTEAASWGAVSLTYHYSQRFGRLNVEPPYMHFLTGKSFSRKAMPPAHVEALHRCHEFVIKGGKPIILSKYYSMFFAVEPEITEAMYRAAKDLGVIDQYLVPVFGPHNVNGVIAFGLPKEVTDQDGERLSELEAIATYFHNQFVRSFERNPNEFRLSSREREVLKWIAVGKTNSEIAIIMGVKSNTVDTYIRRIFEKMDAQNRVEAAVTGVVNGLVELG